MKIIAINESPHQFTDYDKYVSSAFSEPHKRQQRDEQFPKDLQSAFDTGVKVAHEIQDETVKGEPIDHTFKSFQIAGSQGQLNCRIQMPEGDGKCPMVILSHGFGGDMTFHLWDPIIERLNAAGIGAVRYDFNGCGKSEGEFQDMTVPNEIEDLMAVITWTRIQPRTESISLVGHSQGGVVSGMAAGECGATQINRLVLLSAAAVLREDALRGNSQGASFDSWHLDKPYYVVPGRGLKIGRDYIQTAMNLPIYETTSKYSGPTLIINGMADTVVPYTYAELYHKVLNDSQLIIIPGENHTYTVSPDYAVGLVSDWLIKELK